MHTLTETCFVSSPKKHIVGANIRITLLISLTIIFEYAPFTYIYMYFQWLNAYFDIQSGSPNYQCRELGQTFFVQGKYINPILKISKLKMFQHSS